MMTSDAPDIFSLLGASAVDNPGLDRIVAESGDTVVALFLWGENCYNCEQAKGALRLALDKVLRCGFRWLHADVYAHPEIAQRFALHGIPVFLFFHRGKKLGKITAYPGNDAFVATLERIAAQCAMSSPLPSFS